jgi:hypothetical protein
LDAKCLGRLKKTGKGWNLREWGVNRCVSGLFAVVNCDIRRVKPPDSASAVLISL